MYINFVFDFYDKNFPFLTNNQHDDNRKNLRSTLIYYLYNIIYTIYYDNLWIYRS